MVVLWSLNFCPISGGVLGVNLRVLPIHNSSHCLFFGDRTSAKYLVVFWDVTCVYSLFQIVTKWFFGVELLPSIWWCSGNTHVVCSPLTTRHRQLSFGDRTSAKYLVVFQECTCVYSLFQIIIDCGSLKFECLLHFFRV